MRAALFAFALAPIAVTPFSAQAQVINYTLRWRAPLGVVTSYRVYVRTESKAYGPYVDTGPLAPGPDGIVAQSLGGFDPRAVSFVSVKAVGPGGESPFSNELRIPAQETCAKSCDDGDSCTADRCEGSTCVAVRIQSASCGATPAPPLPNQTPVPPAPPQCTPGQCAELKADSCEIGTCDAALGCVFHPAGDGADCDDGDPETLDDQCGQGICRGAPACSPRGEPRGTRLSWTGDPARTMTVQWDGPKRAFGRVRVRPLGVEAWSEIGAAVVDRGDCSALYRASLVGLSPRTAYEYALQFEDGSGPVWSAAQTFQTAPALGEFEGKDYKVAFIANVGLAGAPKSPAADRVLAQLVELQPDLVLGGGGYAYSADAPALVPTKTAALDRWFGELKPLFSRAPFLPVFGASEASAGGDAGEQLEDYRSRIATLPGEPVSGSFSFDVARTHYVALNAPRPDVLTPALLDWLDRDLAAARPRGLVFLVVYTHLDLYTTHPAAVLPADKRAQLTSIFDRHRVNLVLGGETPGVERSRAIRAGVAIPFQENAFATPDLGVIYLRAGSTGREDYRSWVPSQPPPRWLGYSESDVKSFVMIYDTGGSSGLFVSIIGVPDETGFADARETFGLFDKAP